MSIWWLKSELIRTLRICTVEIVHNRRLQRNINPALSSNVKLKLEMILVQIYGNQKGIEQLRLKGSVLDAAVTVKRQRRNNIVA